MQNKNHPAWKVWSIFYPIALSYAILMIVMAVFQGLFGTSEQRYMLGQSLSSLCAFPAVYAFYRSDRRENKEEKVRKSFADAIWIVLIALFIGFSLNNLISMSFLTDISQGYEEANRHFYGSTLAIELLGAACVTPFLEEFLYRGVVYGRLKKMLGWIPAVFLSAFLFALIHWNLVQFLYAFLMGIVLALFAEKSKSVYGALLGHMTVNAAAVVRTETGSLAQTVDKSPFAWTVSVISGVLGLLLLGWYVKRKK